MTIVFMRTAETSHFNARLRCSIAISSLRHSMADTLNSLVINIIGFCAVSVLFLLDKIIHFSFC